jgi:hypothetical protein
MRALGRCANLEAIKSPLKNSFSIPASQKVANRQALSGAEVKQTVSKRFAIRRLLLVYDGVVFPHGLLDCLTASVSQRPTAAHGKRSRTASRGYCQFARRH